MDRQNQPGTWPDVAACTLPTEQRPLRVAEFDAVLGEHLTDVERLDPQHVRLHLVGDASLAEHTRRLAVAESACCSFFHFTVTEPEESVVLDIEVTEAHADALAALVDRVERPGPVGATS